MELNNKKINKKNLFAKKLRAKKRVIKPFLLVRRKIFTKKPKGDFFVADNLVADEIHQVKHFGLTH
ncbi:MULTISPECIES: hypothetical protein [Providencia]|uniref:hypothetical protein n=1 Tax=Providencia TaxID=586 RepID=UPI0005B3BCE9|nr:MULTISPECIES: hypothetical protein [Providencia]HCI95556.1 hypothetical protein [Providencia sp.]AVL74816.1 hypothetical protein CEQ08_14320 [Providencia rettgeri]EIU7557981.1 hypothetical protein [Providencia rettgeri]EJD6670030.1 hypothetical protein [Providencia rettgeri]ELR5054246.1 hypothetical protein [Providencia rettgeri]